jgi:hypothetical protein
MTKLKSCSNKLLNFKILCRKWKMKSSWKSIKLKKLKWITKNKSLNSKSKSICLNKIQVIWWTSYKQKLRRWRRIMKFPELRWSKTTKINELIWIDFLKIKILKFFCLEIFFYFFLKIKRVLWSKIMKEDSRSSKKEKLQNLMICNLSFRGRLMISNGFSKKSVPTSTVMPKRKDKKCKRRLTSWKNSFQKGQSNWKKLLFN